jgi:hypothetical protein
MWCGARSRGVFLYLNPQIQLLEHTAMFGWNTAQVFAEAVN